MSGGDIRSARTNKPCDDAISIVYARRRRHCSDCTTFVCTDHPAPWQLQAALIPSKTCNQFRINGSLRVSKEEVTGGVRVCNGEEWRRLLFPSTHPWDTPSA